MAPNEPLESVSNWQGLSAQKSLRSPFATVSHWIKRHGMAVWFQPGANLSSKKQSAAHTDIYPSPPAWPLLCSVQSPLSPVQRISPVSMREAGGSKLFGLCGYWLDLLTGREEKVTKISRNDKHRNRNRPACKKGKPTLLQAEQPVCALLIWIPHEKAQVTESLFKQPSERDLFGVFSSKLEGKKNPGNKQGFWHAFCKRGFCDAPEC